MRFYNGHVLSFIHIYRSSSVYTRTYVYIHSHRRQNLTHPDFTFNRDPAKFHLLMRCLLDFHHFQPCCTEPGTLAAVSDMCRVAVIMSLMLPAAAILTSESKARWYRARHAFCCKNSVVFLYVCLSSCACVCECVSLCVHMYACVCVCVCVCVWEFTWIHPLGNTSWWVQFVKMWKSPWLAPLL